MKKNFNIILILLLIAFILFSLYNYIFTEKEGVTNKEVNEIFYKFNNNIINMPNEIKKEVYDRASNLVNKVNEGIKDNGGDKKKYFRNL
jgi:hypothetical protein